MATQHSPSKTPSRRALGDLTPRAINTPSKQTKTFISSQAARANSPLKPTQPPRMFADKENFAAPDALFTPRKRSINEVDGVESVEQAKMIARRRDAPLVRAGTQLTTAAVLQQTDNIPVALVPGSPTERNTPTPEREFEPIPNSQTSNQSFSDFVNYGLCASQKSQHDLPPTSTPSADWKTSRAQLLRTRLNFATYKVKTNQVSKRGSDIISTWETKISSSSDGPDASMLPSFTESVHRVPDITVSSPRREPAFVKANLDPFRPISTLGPAPIQFQPPTEAAPVNSRMIHDYHPGSSPPAALSQSASPEQLMSSKREPGSTSPTSKPTQANKHEYGQNAGAGAEADESKHDRLQRLKGQAFQDSDLANNVVKGNAAEGLIELMNSGRR